MAIIIIIVTPAALPLVVLTGPLDGLWGEGVDVDRGEAAELLAGGEEQVPVTAGKPTAGVWLGGFREQTLGEEMPQPYY